MGMQQEGMKKLLNAVGSTEITDSERATLEWLSGYPLETIENICSILTKVKNRGGGRRKVVALEDVQACKALGCTQMETAKRLNVSQSTVGRYWHK